MVFYSIKARKPNPDKLILFVATRCTDRYRVENQDKVSVDNVQWDIIIGKREPGKTNPYRRLGYTWDTTSGFNEWQVKSWAYIPIDYMDRLLAGENQDTLQSEADDEWVGRSVKKAKRSRRPKTHKKTYVMRSKRSIDIT